MWQFASDISDRRWDFLTKKECGSGSIISTNLSEVRLLLLLVCDAVTM
jgi:hypothetical protein